MTPTTRNEAGRARKHTRVVATLPLRALGDGKRRLQERLNAEQRRTLIMTLCSSVVRALRESEVVAMIGLVSRDKAALQWGQTLGLTPILEQESGLNGALLTATTWAQSVDATAQLIVLPDLPRLGPDDVRAVVQDYEQTTGVVICPDRGGTGTNMLLMRPCGIIPPQFGLNSYERHKEAARAAGVRTWVYDAPGTWWDIDTPADLDELGFRP